MLIRAFVAKKSYQKRIDCNVKFEPVTIKDIAKALGLSTSTVSRALRGSYEISNETKKLVLEYAEKINYRPNPIALSLKERRSRSIGVIVPEIANNFFSQAINGIESIAYNRGYHVIISQSHESVRKRNGETFITWHPAQWMDCWYRYPVKQPILLTLKNCMKKVFLSYL
jgi:transcriptional regulator with XRE-family HTH domain